MRLHKLVTNSTPSSAGNYSLELRNCVRIKLHIMIIESKKIIYIHTRKCGGSSIIQSFGSDITDWDRYNCGTLSKGIMPDGKDYGDWDDLLKKEHFIFSIMGFNFLVWFVSLIFGNFGIEMSLGNLFLLSSSKLHLPPMGCPSAPINIPDFLRTSL